MTDQEMFDRVARHLIKQGRKSVSRSKKYGTMCRYRGPNGTMCGIGCLIPNKQYTHNLENKTADHGAVQYAAGLSCFQIPLALALQITHDDRPAQSWPKRLRGVAAEYGLNTKDLDRAIARKRGK